MRAVLTGIVTGGLMLVFILPLDYFGFLRSHVVQVPFLACTAVLAGFIAARIVEWVSRRPG
jgi:hypothetical protein